MAKKSTKLLAAFLALVMCLGMLPATALAATSDSQIVKQGTTVTSSDGYTTISKTVAGTGTENVFDITLKVDTKSSTTDVTYTKDSAVVLTIDLSNTMFDNAIDGVSRTQVAIDTSKTFITKYGEQGQNMGSARYIAVVAFAGPAQTYIDWIDVSDEDNRSAVLTKMGSIGSSNWWKDGYRGGQTNIEGGLQLTYELLKEKSSSVDYSYGILLSDGSPTAHIHVGDSKNSAGDYYYVCLKGNCSGSTCVSNGDGTGSIVNTPDYVRAEAAANKVKGLANTKLYAIAVAADAWLYKTDSGHAVGGQTAAEWLTDITGSSSRMIPANNKTAVNNAFTTIMNTIKSQTVPEKTWAKAVKVTDSLPSQFALVSGPTVSAGSVSGMTWNIGASDAGSFTMTYRVRLKNEASGFVSGKDYATNGTTTLTYYMMTDSTKEASKTLNFTVPQVEGYLASLSFAKKDNTGASVSGAEFALTHASDCGCGVSISAKTATSGRNGSVSFTNIPSGHEYVLTETSAPETHYVNTAKSAVTVAMGKLSVAGNLVEDGVVINISKVSVTVDKVWDDADDQDGKRPSSVTVQLYADGEAYGSPVTLSASNSWEHTWNNLDPNSAYTVEETGVPAGYTAEVSRDKDSGVSYSYTVTNTHAPEMIDISGSKTWDDADDQDGKRPDSIRISLLANGTPVSIKTVTEADGWKWSFTEQPKYSRGVEIDYSVTEETVDGYTTVIEGYDVTNTHVPEKTEISGSKTWDDADNQDGIRPESIRISLLANGRKVAETTVSEADGWSWTFSDLDKYSGGKLIDYTVEEDEVAGYSAAVSGYDVTNKHIPEVVDISGAKTWDDADDQDGKRPESITINLLADGVVVDSKAVTEADNWEWSFTGYPKYKVGAVGQPVSYTVTEETVDGYTTVVDGYDVTNSYIPEKTEVGVSKVWDDADDQDGVRPDSVTVVLLADGNDTGLSLELAADNSWAGTFTELDKYRDHGVEIVYTVSENEVDGYTTAITGSAADGYTVTNTHIPEKTEISVSKLWDDGDDRHGIRPENVTVVLLADGNDTGLSIDLTAENGWAGAFTELDKYRDGGIEIEYTVDEAGVPAGYVKSVSGSDGAYTITNTIPAVQLTVTKLETGSTLPERQEVYQFRILSGYGSDLQPLSVGTVYTVGGVEKTVAEAGIIELKADETAALTFLAGTAYKVEELVDTNYSYRAYYENEQGTISLMDPQNIAVTVTNEYMVPDAAVVLTVDMSGTMYRFKMDGKRYVDVAKAKALAFVEQYAASTVNDGDKRMLAIARFDTDAKVVLNWVDVSTADGLAAAKSAINAMKVADNGSASSNQVCTNFDGGIILTRNMMKQSAVQDIDKKFAIILSDGAPTVTVNEDTDVVGTIKSSFWGNQKDEFGKTYQIRRYGGGWTHPAEVARTLRYMATGENNLADLTVNYRTEDGDTKEGIFIVGVGGDMSFKLFNDAVYGTSNGTRSTDVKKKPAAFNNIDALQGYTQAQILAMTAGDWMGVLADRIDGTYESANNSAALQAELDKIIEVIKDVTNP